MLYNDKYVAESSARKQTEETKDIELERVSKSVLVMNPETKDE